MFKILFFSVVLTAFALSCTQQEQRDSMTVDELKTKLTEGSNTIILDVRTPEELVGPLGKMNGVINIPIQELENRINELEKYRDKEIAVVCRSGARSDRGTKILNKNGFNAKNVIGGMLEYRRSKKE